MTSMICRKVVRAASCDALKRDPVRFKFIRRSLQAVLRKEPGRPDARDTAAQRSVTVPPFGMASPALDSRFKNT